LPTFIVSIFSMNVHIPIENYRHAFWVITALAGASAAIVAILWRSLRW
jgi:Mg2+ and Co2+ transporter CorA